MKKLIHLALTIGRPNLSRSNRRPATMRLSDCNSQGLRLSPTFQILGMTRNPSASDDNGAPFSSLITRNGFGTAMMLSPLLPASKRKASLWSGQTSTPYFALPLASPHHPSLPAPWTGPTSNCRGICPRFLSRDAQGFWQQSLQARSRWHADFCP